jgi:NADH:ubiquinone oxidoreductase subunit 6 (subunit J)
MQIGTSLFLIAVGAILRYAVTTTVSGIELTTVGLILMIVGAVGVVLSLVYMAAWRPRGEATRERVVERDPPREPPV